MTKKNCVVKRPGEGIFVTAENHTAKIKNQNLFPTTLKF